MEKGESVMYVEHAEQDFCLNTFGYSQTEPGHTYGPAVRSYYLIHYILSGKGTFERGGQRYHLHAGHGFLITPESQTRYASDLTEPWSYVWVGFNGRQAPKIIKSLGLAAENPCFSVGDGSGLKECVLAMLKRSSVAQADKYYCWGKFFEFISLIAGARREFLPKSDENNYVAQATEYIENHIHEPITVQEIAKYLNMNRSYLSTLFTRYMKLPPHDYIKLCRLTRARHLLESSTISIASIANSCGYERSESLVRAFRQQYGIAPGAYRKQKNEQLNK